MTSYLRLDCVKSLDLLLPWWLGYSTFMASMAMTGSLVATLFAALAGAVGTAAIIRRRQ